MDAGTESMFNDYGFETQTAKPSQASTKLVLVDDMKEIVKQFLEDIQFERTTPFAKDHQLEAAVWNYITSQNMGKETQDAALAKLKISVTFVQQTYTFLPFDVRVCCSILFLYMFLVDDIADDFMEGLQAFNQNFTMNRDHSHPLLTGFDAHLRSLSRYYGQYCHSAIVKSVFDYVNGRILEHKMLESNFKFPPGSKLMPTYLRHMVGGAESMVHVLFPESLFPEEKYVMKYFPIIKELVDISVFTNDILSYFKESVMDSEKGNFVSNFAETHHMLQVDVLRNLTSHTPQLLQGVYRMLEGDDELLPPVKNYMSGMPMLFTAHRRYHLVELFADEQYLPPYDEDS